MIMEPRTSDVQCCAHGIEKMIATEQEMKDARIPVAWRDYCAHILIKLN